MKQLFMMVALISVTLQGNAQAVNPQNTFSNAVNVAGPSLWLNYNDSTPSFKDSISGVSFPSNVTPTISPAATCSNGVSSGTSATTCTMTTTAGDTAILFANAQASTISTLVDSGGSTCGPITSGAFGAAHVYAYSCPNLTAGSHTFTMTLAASVAYPILQGIDVAGAATVAPVETYAAFNATTSPSTSIASGQVTTTLQNDLLVGWVDGSTNTLAFNSPFTALSGGPWTGILPVSGYALSPGSYAFTGTMNNTAGYASVLVAVKSASIPMNTVLARQPGFDSTNNSNFSAAFPYNSWAMAPNTTMAAIDWNSPWTMLVHVDRLNWDRTGTIVLASKGDIGSVQNSYWELYLRRSPSFSTASQLCFQRNGYGMNQAQQVVCTGPYLDAMPNGFNYDIVIEDTGTGQPSALHLYLNGLSVLQITGSGSYAYGFGNVSLALAGGTGYADATAFTSSGGGANCVVTGMMYASGGVPTSITTSTGNINAGCTSNPTIVLTSPTGTGVVITATAKAMSMNSSTGPLMVPGYVSNGVLYGAAGGDAAQGPVNIDEFALFSGNLSFGSVTNIFYETKFYQSLLYAYTTPPKVILDSCCCGPDFSGDQTLAMAIGAHKAGLIQLVGMVDNDGNPNGTNSVGWWRQMLDEAGLNDIGVSVGPNSPVANIGGCSAANITAYNASTPQNASSYESSVTMYRRILAANPSTPVDILITQGVNGYTAFLASAADSISPLTGLQLQAQNAANGAIVNLFNGNFNLTPTQMTYLLNNNGPQALDFFGGTPAPGGPGIFVSRTSNDPLYKAAVGTGQDTISGWTNLNVAQILSPYFWGGVLISYSGGTGYANQTPFTSTGGGPYCHVTGIMTASGGVPNGIDTAWGTPLPASTAYNGLGYGCTSAPTITLTSPTGTGVTLTASTTIIPSNYEGGANQFVVYPSQWAQTSNSTSDNAPVFTWFQNSLMDPPTNGTPRSY